jgi:geranylgeranyl pyrophosphate synthase
MDIFTQTIEYISLLPVVPSWPEVHSLFATAATSQPHDWRLPMLACEAVGGNMELAIPAVASIAMLQASIILIDDMLDADSRGKHLEMGMPAVANLASALQALSLEAIYRSHTPSETKAITMHSLGHMMAQTALGQYWDTQNLVDEDAYWRTVRTKSAPFFGAALYVGALLGDADLKTAKKIRDFGFLYGEMIQIHDDLNDTMSVPASPDWKLGRPSLPILFALTVPHPKRDLFIELRDKVSDPGSLRAAQAILLGCGAVSYCVDQILRRYQVAQERLAAIRLEQPEKLEEILETIVRPVQALLQLVDADVPQTLFEQLSGFRANSVQ